MYEHSRFSRQMPLVMAIFLAYFIIKFPYLAHMCIFPWKTILPNGVSDVFLQKMDFPFSFIFFAFSGNTLVPAVILKNRRHYGVAVPAVPEDNRQHCVDTAGGRRKMHHRTVRWIVRWLLRWSHWTIRWLLNHPVVSQCVEAHEPPRIHHFQEIR